MDKIKYPSSVNRGYSLHGSFYKKQRTGHLVSILCQSRLFTPLRLIPIFRLSGLGIHPLSIEAIHSTLSLVNLTDPDGKYPSSVNRGYSLHSVRSANCSCRQSVSILCQSRLFTPPLLENPTAGMTESIHPLSIEAIHSTCRRRNLWYPQYWYPSSVNRGYSLHFPKLEMNRRGSLVSILCQSRLFTPLFLPSQGGGR